MHATLQPRLFSRWESPPPASYPHVSLFARVLASSPVLCVDFRRRLALSVASVTAAAVWFPRTSEPTGLFALGEPRHNQFLRRQLWLGPADSFYRSRQRSWESFLCVCAVVTHIFVCLASRLNSGGAFDFLASAQTPPPPHEILRSGRDLCSPVMHHPRKMKPQLDTRQLPILVPRALCRVSARSCRLWCCRNVW